MKEIKFRAWDKETTRIIEWDEIWQYADTATLQDVFNPRYILMEFTGLHDKTDKEIYEGDICKVVSISYGKRIGEVKFCRGCFIISFGEQADGYNSDVLYVPLKVEVISNIYEDPGLLHDVNKEEDG